MIVKWYTYAMMMNLSMNQKLFGDILCTRRYEIYIYNQNLNPFSLYFFLQPIIQFALNNSMKKWNFSFSLERKLSRFLFCIIYESLVHYRYWSLFNFCLEENNYCCSLPSKRRREIIMKSRTQVIEGKLEIMKISNWISEEFSALDEKKNQKILYEI